MSTENATSVLDAKNEDKSLFENIMDSCRLCMEVHKNMKDLFTEEHGKIIERIHFCTGLQLIKEEWLPTNICEKCTENLTVAHSFKTTCLTSNEYYQNVITKIKMENRDTEFDDHFDNNVDDEKDCKDILKEVLKLSDIKLSKMKKENNSLDRRKRQVKLNKTKNSSTKLAKGVKKSMKTIKLSKPSCDVCNIDYTSKEQLAEHRKSVHTEKETFVCEVCGKVMLHRSSLYTHMQSHLPPRHACDTCDYKTWHKHDLMKHKRIHSGVKMFQCEFCTASYHTSSNLRHHIRSNHENAPKTFQCRLCERSFYDRAKLQRHVDAHNDIKRYECEVCHSCFTRRCYWKKHLLRQHGVVIPPTRPGRQKVNLVIGEIHPQTQDTDHKAQETDYQTQDTDHQIQDTDHQIQDTGYQIKEIDLEIHKDVHAATTEIVVADK